MIVIGDVDIDFTANDLRWIVTYNGNILLHYLSKKNLQKIDYYRIIPEQQAGKEKFHFLK